MAYYRRAMEKGRAKFERFAKNVWGVNTAEEGLEALKSWMVEIGLPLTITEIGATPEMIDGIVSTTEIFPAGFLDLTPEDIKEILKESI
jgi:alcohol dehydrogenase YqhD (iron-dependent ADH family)